MSTRATIVIKFGEDVVNSSSYHAVAELDDDMNKDAKGDVKSSFSPGDDVYFLLQHDSRVQVRAIKTTSGQVQAMGTVSRTKKQFMLFTDSNHKIRSNYILNSVSATWYGNSGSISHGASENSATHDVSASGTFPCNANVNQGVSFQLFRLIPNTPETVSEDGYPVSVVIYMEVP